MPSYQAISCIKFVLVLAFLDDPDRRASSGSLPFRSVFGHQLNVGFMDITWDARMYIDNTAS